MRYLQYTVSGYTEKLTVTYPDINVFSNDNNWIEITSPLEVIVVSYTVMKGGETIGTYGYRSPFKRLKISLNNIMNYVIDRYSDSNVSVGMGMTVTVGSQTFNVGGLYFNVLRGTSYPDRTHGSLYIYNYGDDPGSTEIYCPTHGTITLPDSLGTVDVTAGLNYLDLSGISGTGVHQLHFTTSSLAPGAVITSVTPQEWSFYVNIDYIDNSGYAPFSWLGDILHRTEHLIDNYNIQYEIVERCPGDTVKLKFFDADGCVRVVAGRIVGLTEGGEKTDLLYESGVYNNIPNYAWTGATKDMVVYFGDMPREFHLEDIFQSVGIWYEDTSGYWQRCSVSTKSLKIYDETADYEITFTINKR